VTLRTRSASAWTFTAARGGGRQSQGYLGVQAQGEARAENARLAALLGASAPRVQAAGEAAAADSTLPKGDVKQITTALRTTTSKPIKELNASQQ
jgi:hypothetical protein